MQTCFSGRAYPGHGAVAEDGKAKIVQYINHRQQRENEVLRVLKFGTLEVSDANNSGGEPSPDRQSSWTPLELVKVIYRDVPEALHLPASHGVTQVLLKLESEGKVAHDEVSGRWSLYNGKSAL